MSEEPKKGSRHDSRTPEELLEQGRLVATIGVIELAFAAVLYCRHLDLGTWLERLRGGTTIGGLIALSVGLMLIGAGWRARR